MADNSVTIALKLDTSQFNAGLSQVQSGLKAATSSISGKNSGLRTTWLNKQDVAEMERTAKEIGLAFRDSARFDMGNLKKDARAAEKMMNEAVKMNIAARAQAFPLEGKDSVKSAVGGGKQQNILEKLLGVNIKGVAQGVAAGRGNWSAANTLGLIESVLAGAVAGSLGTLVVVAGLIIIAISALMTATKPIMKILGAIGKVLGAALIPMAMVIVTLLSPLILILMPLVRIMNMVFRPLRTLILQMMKGKKETLGDNMRMSSLDINGIIAGGLADFGLVLFSGVIQQIVGLGEAISTTIATIFMSILGYTGEEIAQATAGIHNFFQGISDSIDVEVGKILEKANIKVPVKSEDKTEPEAPKSSPITEWITTQAAKLSEEIGKINFQQLVTDAKTFFVGDSGSVKSTALDAWTKMVGDANAQFPLIAGAFRGFLNSIIGMANVIIGNINQVINQFGLGIVRANFLPLQTVGDAVITPAGQIIRTSPQDYIMATTNPQGMGGGGNVTNISINVSGNVDDKTARFITDTVQREIATAWRSIAR